MSYTECYLTHGAQANDLNAGAPLGADDGYVLARTNCTATGTDPYSIEDLDNTGWSGVQVGDFGRWDTAGAGALFRVTVLNYGADSDVIRVVSVGAGITPAAGKAVRIGGAFATLDAALSGIRKTYRNSSDDPPRINVKADAAYTGNATADHSGESLYPITVQGYMTSPGDGGEAELQLGLTCNQSWLVLRDLYVNRKAIGDGIALDGKTAGERILLDRVRARSSGATSECIALYRECLYLGCTVVDSDHYGFEPSSYSHRFIGCVSQAAGDSGFRSQSYSSWLHCLSYGNTGDCFRIDGGAAVQMFGCVGYGSTGGSGVLVAASDTKYADVRDCVFWGNNQYGIEGLAAGTVWEDHNAMGSNTAGARLNVAAHGQGANDITLSGDPFVDAAAGDFRIDPRTAAGRQLIEAGYPQALNGADDYADVGAMQTKLKRAMALIARR